jgi:hypothetical protein
MGFCEDSDELPGFVKGNFWPAKNNHWLRKDPGLFLLFIRQIGLCAFLCHICIHEYRTFCYFICDFL